MDFAVTEKGKKMRLIDADALREKAYQTYPASMMNPYGGDYVVKMEDIDNAPTIEAEPVRHGRWLYDSCEMEFFCSVCSREAPVGMTTYHITNYCPNCGAKMDGE